MSRHKHKNDIKVEFTNNRNENDDQNDDTASNGYVEFMGITRVRSGTSVNDDIELSEKIINDIVAMDASFDKEKIPDLSTGYKKLFSTKKGSNLGRREKYGNFHTIDWLRDIAKDRYRHKWIIKEKENGKLFEKIQAWFDALSGWFCVLLVGMGAGLVAGIVDVGSSWTIQLRSGVCKKAFWLNREQCCWGSSDIRHDKYHNVLCEQWYSWTKLLGMNEQDNALGYIISMSIYVLFSMLFALMAASLVKVYAPYACGSGVPEIKTILGGFVIRGYLGKWTLLIKSIGMILGTSAGLVLGKEGPFVHVASCCGNIFSYLFPKYGNNEAKKREILSAAASAGVAVAFGAPIGGVLFSLEEVSYYFPLKTLWRSFFCAMFAAFIVKTVSPYGKGHDVLFNVDYKAEWSFFELIPFIILGILGGLFGYYFIKVNLFWCKKRKSTRLGRYPIVEVVIITLITALIAYQNEYTRMSMSELVRRLVGKCGPSDESLLCDYRKNVTSAKDNVIHLEAQSGVYESIWKLFLALIFYLVMLVLTFGVKVPCGLFVPSLTIGAITGRLVGIVMELISFKYPNSFLFANECQQSDECIIPGIYALVGACAFLGGATRMTVSLVVIMVELTSGLSLIVPLMVSAFTAKLFGEMLCKGGIYDAHINLNNYPFLDNKEEFMFNTMAYDVMRPQKNDPPLTVMVQDGMTVGEVEQIMNSSKLNGFPVVVSKESQYLLGFILKRDMEMAFNQYRANDIITEHTKVKFSNSSRNNGAVKLYKLVDLAPICVTDQTPVEVVLDLFRKMGVSIVLVTHYGKLLGVITKKDILRHIASQNERKKKEILL